MEQTREFLYSFSIYIYIVYEYINKLSYILELSHEFNNVLYIGMTLFVSFLKFSQEFRNFNIVTHLYEKRKVQRERSKVCFTFGFGTRNVSFRLFESGAHVSEGSIPSFVYEGYEGLSLQSCFTRVSRSINPSISLVIA